MDKQDIGPQSVQNRGKPLKWLDTNAINWDTELHSALGMLKPRVQLPSLPLTGLKLSISSSPSVMDTVTGWSQGCNRMWQASQNFLVNTKATYSVVTSYSGAFSNQTCTIWGTTGETITKKIHQSTFLLLGWTDIYPTISGGLIVSLSPYLANMLTKLGTTLVMGKFSAPRDYSPAYN